jgi:membrane protein implicated in regulation of membrane protease activity
MDDNANREVTLLTRDLDRAIALGNRLWIVFYIGVGIAISHALFGFPGFNVSVDHLGLAIASVIFISISWAVVRSVLRQRKVAKSQEGDSGNRFLG